MRIDEMQAGRETDKIIANKMGWTWNGETAFGPNGEHNDNTKHPFWWLPNYSSDIAAAWEVVEKMPMPLELAKSYEKIYNVGPIGWQVCWCLNEMSQCEGCNDDCRCTSGNDVWAETAPLAICRAALKVVLGSDEI